MVEITKPTEFLFAEDAASKARSVLSNYAPNEWVVSYSGGADSDTLMHFLRSIGFEPTGVFFNTGFEYQATKRHIEWMRSQGFKIVEAKAYKTIPVAIKRGGAPFWSKFVSEMLHRLMINGFKFENLPFDELLLRYPRAKSALRWWTNGWKMKRRNIAWNSGLKEFLIAHPPQFAIHNSCCDYAKKYTSRKYARENGIKLILTGIRKSEGGIRASAYKSCFLPKGSHYEYDIYMPIFWWSNTEKQTWDGAHGVRHSDCYCVYGLDRTGCAACPYGKDFERELEVLRFYEPLLFKAANNLFGESYDYMRSFEQFREDLKAVSTCDTKPA